jgi:hypothetical protein
MLRDGDLLRCGVNVSHDLALAHRWQLLNRLAMSRALRGHMNLEGSILLLALVPGCAM